MGVILIALTVCFSVTIYSIPWDLILGIGYVVKIIYICKLLYYILLIVTMLVIINTNKYLSLKKKSN